MSGQAATNKNGNSEAKALNPLSTPDSSSAPYNDSNPANQSSDGAAEHPSTAAPVEGGSSETNTGTAGGLLEKEREVLSKEVSMEFKGVAMENIELKEFAKIDNMEPATEAAREVVDNVDVAKKYRVESKDDNLEDNLEVKEVAKEDNFGVAKEDSIAKGDSLGLKEVANESSMAKEDNLGSREVATENSVAKEDSLGLKEVANENSMAKEDNLGLREVAKENSMAKEDNVELVAKEENTESKEVAASEALAVTGVDDLELEQAAHEESMKFKEPAEEETKEISKVTKVTKVDKVEIAEENSVEPREDTMEVKEAAKEENTKVVKDKKVDPKENAKQSGGAKRKAVADKNREKLKDVASTGDKEEKKITKTPGQVKSEKSEAKKKRASLRLVFKLFSYATAFDWLLMFLAATTAIIHGGALPTFALVFGDFIDLFLDQDRTQIVSEQIALALGNNDTGMGLRYLNVSDLDCDNPDPFDVPFLSELLPLNVSIEFVVPGRPDPAVVIVTLTEESNWMTVLESIDSRCLDEEAFIQGINTFVFVFLGIAFGVFTFAYFEISLFQTACERQVKKIRLAFYKAIMRQEVGWFDANPSGELASRIADDVDKIHDGIGDKLGLLIQWLATFVGGFVVAFITEFRLTLLLLAFTPLLAIGGFAVAKATSALSSVEQKHYASAGAVAEEVLSSIRTVVAFGGQAKERERYDAKLKEARLVGAKKGAATGGSLGFIYFLFFTVNGVALWFGAYLIDEKIIIAGDVYIVFFSVIIGAFALGQGMPNLEVLLTAAGSAEFIFNVIKRKPVIDPTSKEGDKPDKLDGVIELKNVCFTYPTRADVKVLNDFSLSVRSGQTFALVGASGCGKSTVVQLLQRFYDPDSGEVLVGGRDVRSLNVKWLRQQIGVVSQEPVLFDSTIAQNIMYGKEGATEEEMKKAAMNANAHDFISKLPDRYNTLVGEGGTQLSGGQKQRVAIARALIRDPKILLLDEATSALDTESESIVQQALDRARAGRTTIVIAHRLSTIQNADVIASVEDGRIVELGTHSELMDKGGLYYELVTAQSCGTSEQEVQLEQALYSGAVSTPEADHEASKGKAESRKSASPVPKGKKLAVKTEEEWDKDIPEVPLGRIIAKNAPEWWIITLGLIAAFLSGVLFPAYSIFFGEVLDVLLVPPGEVLQSIHLWGILLILLASLSGLANFGKILAFNVAGENLTSRMRSQAFKAMLRQEIGWFDEERNSSGALTTRLADDAAKIQGATGTRLGTLLETSIGMLASIVIAFAYSWVMTLLILAVVPLVFISGALEVKALSGHAMTTKKSQEKAGKVAVDSISNIRTVASLSLEDSFYSQYSRTVSEPYKKALFNCVVYGVTYAFSQCVVFLMYAVVFRFGAFLVTRPEDHLVYTEFNDLFVVFFALVFGAAGSGQAGAFAPSYSKARLSANRIFFLLNREPKIDSYSEKGEKLSKVFGKVSACDVQFNYPSRPDVTVLRGMELDVKPGETLALVGPSGCGKSTVVSLLERFYNPTSGVLTLDGTNIADLNISWLRRQIGIVSQEPVLFDRSIADNIRYGANFREVSTEEVVEAARAANIHNFICSLPQGYNTNVGKKGTQLSGGQKQRIAIARALVRDPKILLLDEATSALDTESEKIVQEALDKAREGRTSIVIAHRLSTIYNSNCIVVISDGKAVEKGTHKELMEKKGIYYKLNKFQVVEGARK